ncbi:MAG: PAS domain S-box protein, partial [Lentisphaeria bacterium]|nr:PAS domain S-box protein [Lentisphaeria bacterium]
MPAPVQGGGRSAESWASDEIRAYAELKRSIYDGLLIVDEQARIIEVNSRAGQLLGYTHEEFMRLKVTQLIYGADESHLRAIRQNVRQGSFTLIRASCLRKSGDDFPAEIASHEIRFGNSANLCFFIRDVSERVEMEQDLIRLSKAVESSSDAITITDEEHETVFRNAAFRALFGDSSGSTEEAQGGFADLFGDEAVAAEMQHALRTRQTWSTEIDVKLPDDRLVSTLCRADAVRLGDGDDSFGTVAILTDITEQKNTERRLQAARDELAHSNAELEQFAYVASHDLKEPLRAIVGYLQLLSRRYSAKLDSQAADYIRHAVEGAERMRELINHVLDYSRLDRPSG